MILNKIELSLHHQVHKLNKTWVQLPLSPRAFRRAEVRHLQTFQILYGDNGHRLVTKRAIHLIRLSNGTKNKEAVVRSLVAANYSPVQAAA